MYLNGSDCDPDDGLGFAIAPIVAPIIGGLFKKSKDPERLAANAKAYADGQRNANANFIAGDGKDTGVTPLAFLLLKSPIANGGGGGWATDATEKDAFTKYTALKAMYDKGSPATSALPSPTYPSTSGGNPPGLQASLLGGISPVMLGAAALGVFLITRNSGGGKRRRR